MRLACPPSRLLGKSGRARNGGAQAGRRFCVKLNRFWEDPTEELRYCRTLARLRWMRRRERPGRMRGRSMKRIMLTFLLCAASASVLAADRAAPATTSSLAEIRVSQQNLSADIKAGLGAFKGMPPQQRKELLEKQGWLLGRIEGHETLQALSPSDQVEVFNALEWIKSTVNNARGDEKVCERSVLSGTHRFTTTCVTRRERDEHRAGARDALGRVQACTDPSCAGN